jgi:hypothetical protein
MPVAIKSQLPIPQFIGLNSGVNLRLSPGAVSAEIEDVELKDNPKIARLLARRAITLESRPAAAGDAAGAAGTQTTASQTGPGSSAPDPAAAAKKIKPSN